MAFIKPLETIRAMRGKVCMHSDTYFRTNRVTGAVSTGKICYPSTKEPSATQLALQARFKKVCAAVRTRINALTTPEKEALMTAYHLQHSIGSFFGYCFHKWNNEYDQNGDLINNG